MKKYFIIEDNQFHSEWIIKELVNHHIENIVQLTSISQINQLIQLSTIDNHDVFFIDIDLKQSLTGIDVAEQIRKKNAHSNIIFFTAYTNFAVDIINRKILPIGYIRKDRNLSEQIHQVLEQINWKEQQIVNVDKIFIDQKGGSLVLYPREILYIESIKGLKIELEKYTYFLLLKSYCINLSQLQKIDSAHYVLEFFNGDSLLVGRKIFEKTKERFHNFQQTASS